MLRYEPPSADDAVAFPDRDDLIRFDVLQDVGLSTRPSRLDSIDPGRRPETKMLPLIVLA